MFWYVSHGFNFYTIRWLHLLVRWAKCYHWMNKKGITYYTISMAYYLYIVSIVHFDLYFIFFLTSNKLIESSSKLLGSSWSSTPNIFFFFCLVLICFSILFYLRIPGTYSTDFALLYCNSWRWTFRWFLLNCIYYSEAFISFVLIKQKKKWWQWLWMEPSDSN